MDQAARRTAMRVGGLTAIVGSLCALTGAALWASSGTDIDKSLVSNQIAEYLIAAGEHRVVLVANLSIWIVMAFLMGIAAMAMAGLAEGRRLLSDVARYCYHVGVPLVVAAYVAWLAVVLRVAPETTPAAVATAEALGWFASYADWIATMLVIGIGPTFLALAGRGTWAPGWLVKWSYLTAVAGCLTAVAMLTGGSGLSTYGFVIIPVGVFWMMAAGVVLLRNQDRAA